MQKIEWNKKARAVFEWRDLDENGKPITEAIGWVAVHEFINNVAGGGIFMHANATQQETEDIALNMSKKFTVCRPQIGGAKSGICYDHTKPDARDVLRRFVIANKHLLQTVYVTAGDLNTDDAFIESVIQKDCGLPTCQAALGTSYAKATNTKNRNSNLANIIQYPATKYFKMIEAAVGYGLAASIETTLKLCKVEMASILIQGFGAVGSSLAYYLEKKKIARVVGIADKDGFIHDKNGLPIETLLEIRAKKHQQLVEEKPGQSKLTECAKNIVCNLSKEEREFFHCELKDSLCSNQEFLIKFLQCEHCQIVSPCAQRYQITKDIAKALQATTFEPFLKENKRCFLIAGSNNTFGTITDEKEGTLEEDKEGDVLKYLNDIGVCVVPDWVANSGTAQLFHRSLSMDFDLQQENIANVILEACAQPIRDFINLAWICLPSSDNTVTASCQLALSCEVLAKKRFEDPIPFGKEEKNNDNGEEPYINPAKSIYALSPLPSNKMLSFSERYRLCYSVACNDKECINPNELHLLLENNSTFVAYDGFEPSGRMHIAQSLYKKILVNRLTKAGGTMIFWIADWFAMLNHKMGGDLNAIQTMGEYFIEVWKAVGMDMSRVRFLWASKEILKRNDEYWALVLDIAVKFNLARIKRCIEIMGRKQENDELKASAILYPVMQAADIFFLGVDICQLGLDQRKVNMLAREYAALTNRKPPIVISHTMLPGLKQDQEKMSKSDPNSAIFTEDSEEDITKKIRMAYCPPGVIEGNPILSYLKFIVWNNVSSVIVTLDNGDEIEFTSYDDMAEAYKNNRISPQQIKTTLTKYLNLLLKPVRDHFAQNPKARELYSRVEKLRVTK